MVMSGTPYIIVLILSINLYFIGVIYLSKKRQDYSGLILPIIFACVAIYNFIKPILVYNPRPTMQEGIYMTFFGALSIIGFVLFSIIKYHSKRKSNNDI